MRCLALAALMLAACHPRPAQLSFEGADYKTDAQKIAHGRRLAHILDCTGCHGSNFQGEDMADKPADGAMYSPNVTLLLPKYTDAELERLIRHGVPKDGRRFWFMQVEAYQFLSDRDLAAVIAYIRTFKPAGRANPPFRFNKVEIKDVQQGLMGDAQAQIAKYRNAQPVDLGSQHAWARYMVKTTCTSCHNNALQGWTNFTPNLDIAGAYSKAELTQLLTNGKGKEGKDVGRMSGIAREHFSHLTPREREAIVDYILARARRA